MSGDAGQASSDATCCPLRNVAISCCNRSMSSDDGSAAAPPPHDAAEDVVAEGVEVNLRAEGGVSAAH